MPHTYLTKNIINIINAEYINHAGPFGKFVCADALTKQKGDNASLPYSKLPHYIEDLFIKLPNEEIQTEFVNGLKKVDDIMYHPLIKSCLETY